MLQAGHSFGPVIRTYVYDVYQYPKLGSLDKLAGWKAAWIWQVLDTWPLQRFGAHLTGFVVLAPGHVGDARPSRHLRDEAFTCSSFTS